MAKIEWILCPVCGNKTRNQIREDTVLLNFPLYCPKCKQETLIEAKKLQVTVIEDIDKKRDRLQCLSPAKKYKVYKSSINKSLHFAQRSLSSSTRVQRVTAQRNLSRE